MIDPFTAGALIAGKIKATYAGAHGAVHMAGLMLDSEDPPLCTNVNHSAINCAESGLPRHKWCKACRVHAERNADAQTS